MTLYKPSFLASWRICFKVTSTANSSFIWADPRLWMTSWYSLLQLNSCWFRPRIFSDFPKMTLRSFPYNTLLLIGLNTDWAPVKPFHFYHRRLSAQGRGIRGRADQRLSKNIGQTWDLSCSACPSPNWVILTQIHQKAKWETCSYDWSLVLSLFWICTEQTAPEKEVPIWGHSQMVIEKKY